MKEPRPETDTVTARRRQLKERVKRGLIAGYIHEISGRHNGGRSVGQEPAERSVESPASP